MALSLVGQQVFIGQQSVGNLIPAEAPCPCGEETNHKAGFLLPELPETLVLIPAPASAAKAVDGYVKPQIKQVVPE